MSDLQTEVIQSLPDKSTSSFDEKERISVASGVAGYFEQFDILVSNLESFRETLPEDCREELEKHIAHLQSLIVVVSEGEFSQPSDLTKVYKSKVERLGLTAPIIKARENGCTIQQMSEMFQVSAYHISKFLKAYSQSTAKQQTEMRKSSIFDVTDRLEDLYTVIQRNIVNLDGEDPRNHVAYVKELRETIQLASDMTEKVVISQKLEKMVEVVSEILLNEVPASNRQRVLTRLADVQDIEFVHSQLAPGK